MPPSSVPSSDPAGSSDSGPRRTRKLVRASPEQLIVLRKSFKELSDVPRGNRLEELVQETGLTKTWVSAWFHRQNRALNRPSSPATIAASDEERKPPSKKQKRNSHEEISSDIESIHPSEFSSQTEYTDQHSNGNKHSGSNGKKLSDSNSSRRLDAVSASMEKMSTYPQRAVNTTGTTELSGKVNNDRLASGQVGGLNLAEMLISGQITGQAYDSLNAHINAAPAIPTPIKHLNRLSPVSTSACEPEGPIFVHYRPKMHPEAQVKQEKSSQISATVSTSYHTSDARPPSRHYLAPTNLNPRCGAYPRASGNTPTLANYGSSSVKTSSLTPALRSIAPRPGAQTVLQPNPPQISQINHHRPRMYGASVANAVQQPMANVWFKECPWSLPDMPPLDPEHAPLKYLKNVMTPYLTAPYPERLGWDELVDKVLYGINVDKDPMEAAMGLVFLRGIGFTWD